MNIIVHIQSGSIAVSRVILWRHSDSLPSSSRSETERRRNTGRDTGVWIREEDEDEPFRVSVFWPGKRSLIYNGKLDVRWEDTDAIFYGVGGQRWRYQPADGSEQSDVKSGSTSSTTRHRVAVNISSIMDFRTYMFRNWWSSSMEFPNESDRSKVVFCFPLSFFFLTLLKCI